MWPNDFFVPIFCHFVKKHFATKLAFWKKKLPNKISLQIYENHHNCLQYERVLEIFYFVSWILSNLDKYTYGWLPFAKHQKIWKKINHVIKHESILQGWYGVHKTNSNFIAISITSACTSFGNSVWKVWFSWRPCYNAFN